MQEADGSKTVYIILPYYSHGNLQDIINANLVNGNHIPEPELLKLFAGICQCIKAMHKHAMKSGGASRVLSSEPRSRANNSSSSSSSVSDQQQQLINSMETQSYDNSSEQHLLEGAQADDDDDNDSDLDLEINFDDADENSNATALGTMVPYAHRDIKPANIMLDNSGRPVLMDLGSAARARITPATRQAALQLQDLAAEHCTLPYRAPELFYVKTDETIDERVDIWSLGCTLFALMYLSSPFEMQAAESGASLNLAISSGEFKFPNTPAYSQELKDIVTRCLTVNPQERPFIDDVMTSVETLLA